MCVSDSNLDTWDGSGREMSRLSSFSIWGWDSNRWRRLHYIEVSQSSLHNLPRDPPHSGTLSDSPSSLPVHVLRISVSLPPSQSREPNIMVLLEENPLNELPLVDEERLPHQPWNIRNYKYNILSPQNLPSHVPGSKSRPHGLTKDISLFCIFI